MRGVHVAHHRRRPHGLERPGAHVDEHHLPGGVVLQQPLLVRVGEQGEVHRLRHGTRLGKPHIGTVGDAVAPQHGSRAAIGGHQYGYHVAAVGGEVHVGHQRGQQRTLAEPGAAAARHVEHMHVAGRGKVHQVRHMRPARRPHGRRNRGTRGRGDLALGAGAWVHEHDARARAGGHTARTIGARVDLQPAQPDVRGAIRLDVPAVGATRAQEPARVRARVRERDVHARRHDHALDVGRRLDEGFRAQDLLRVPAVGGGRLLRGKWRCGQQQRGEGQGDTTGHAGSGGTERRGSGEIRAGERRRYDGLVRYDWSYEAVRLRCPRIRAELAVTLMSV